MFSLRKGQIDKDMYVELKKDLAGSDIDLDKLMETCRLNNTGAFFWNRWKTLEKKPSRITDEKIREFLTQTVRADEDEIMDKIGYVEMIERVKEINFGDYDNREDRHEAFRELFVKTFSQEEFKSSIISLLKNKWYQKLDK